MLKSHDSQRRDRILPIFLSARKSGKVFPHFGAISLLKYAENMEKEEKHPMEKISEKSGGDSAPKSEMSIPCRG